MICDKCYKTFEGRGVTCPSCSGRSDHVRPQSQVFRESESFIPERHDIYPAGYLGRIIASLFDALLLSVVINLILMPLLSGSLWNFTSNIIEKITQALAVSPAVSMMAGNLGSVVLTTLLISLIAPFYFVIMESSRYQGTLGKVLIGLTVTDKFGNPLSIGRAFLRFLARMTGILPIFFGIFLVILIPSKATAALLMPLFTLGVIIQIIMYPVIFFTGFRQGLHDLFSGCIVQEGNNQTSGAGFVAAIAGIVLSFSCLIYFKDVYSKAEKNHKFRTISALKSLEDFNTKNPATSEVETVTYRQIIPEVKKVEPTPVTEKKVIELSKDGMQAYFNGEEVKFEKVTVSMGLTEKSLNINFYQNEQSKSADLKIILNYRWPLRHDCGKKELEGYAVAFPHAGTFGVSFSRIGDTPKDEIADFTCSLANKRIRISGQFYGKEASSANPVGYAWAVNLDSEYSTN